jgi:two-component system, cell cycle sensor histidine kinase and response regulator CckA
MDLAIINGKRTLLVDDEPSVRQSTGLILVHLWGHHVTEAVDGRQGLELFNTGPFDLVITDYRMPGLKGNELACKIRELVPAQKILMITGFAGELGRSRNPVDAILNKPFTVRELQAAMEQIFSRPAPDLGTPPAGCVPAPTASAA